MRRILFGLILLAVAAIVGGLVLRSWDGDADRRLAARRAELAAARDSIWLWQVRSELLVAAAARDSLTIDSLRAAGRVVRVAAAAAAELSHVTGETLEAHLEARSDTAGLRLWEGHRLADVHVEELHVEERSIWQRERNAWEAQRESFQALLALRDSTVATLEVQLAGTFAELEAASRKPSAAARVLRVVPACAGAGVAAWLLSDETSVGVGAGLGCGLVEVTAPEIRLPKLWPF